MAELFVYYPQGGCSSLLDPSIDLIAVITGSDLSAMLVYFLANLSLTQIIDVWPPQVPKVSPAVLLCEKRSSAPLIPLVLHLSIWQRLVLCRYFVEPR